MTLLSLVVVAALGMRCGSSESCPADGEISVRCAADVIPGFKPPDVAGYAIEAVYTLLPTDRNP